LLVFFFYSHGLVGYRTNSNSGQFKTPLVVVYYDVDYVKNVKGTNYWRNRFEIYSEVMHCKLGLLCGICSPADDRCDLQHVLRRNAACFCGLKLFIRTIE
jgi:hypothetical protein